MNLGKRTSVAAAIDEAAKTIFAIQNPGEAGIRLAYLAARADIRAPDSLHFLCQDGKWQSVDSDLLYDVDSDLDCLPEGWLAERRIADQYAQAWDERDRRAWHRWSTSEKSRLLSFPKPQHWQKQADNNPTIWSLVVYGIAQAWNTDWKKRCYVRVDEEGYSKYHPMEVGTPAAAWLHRLQHMQCLPDRFGEL